MLKALTAILLVTFTGIMLFSFTLESPTDGPDGKSIKKGRQMFMNKCASCHRLSTEESIGPGLENITKRQTKEEIVLWALNHKERIDLGDPYAKELYVKYKYYVPTKSGLNETTAGNVFDFLYSLDNDGM